MQRPAGLELERKLADNVGGLAGSSGHLDVTPEVIVFCEVGEGGGCMQGRN